VFQYRNIADLIPPFVVLLALVCGGCSSRGQREGYIRTPDGVRLFYKIVGDGEETLIFVHGGPGNSMESALPDLEPLSRGRTVIYYDQRGNGRSDLLTDPDRLAISKHVEDLETVRKFFKLEKVTLMGNSWGGLLVAFYAVEYPDRVQRMVLHSPGEPTRAFMAEADEAMQLRLNDHFSAEQKKRYAFLSNPQIWIEAEDPKAVCREYFQLLLPFYVADPQSVYRFRGDVCSGPDEAVRHRLFVNEQIIKSLGDWDLLPKLALVDAPVLIIYGEADPAHPDTPRAWAKAFPNSHLLLIKGAGHLPHVEQPEQFFKVVEDFIAGEP
jgi:proline iminopeptidase